MFMSKGLFHLILLSLITIFGSCQKSEEPELIYEDHVEPYEIVDETFRIGARSTAVFSNKSKLVRTIKFPPRTVYWTYWMGAGPEPVEGLAKVAIPLIAQKLTKDPFVAYGWGLISSLGLFEYGTSNADLFFLTSDQIDSFGFNNNSFNSFISKPQTKNIHDNYIDILDTPLDENNSLLVGLRNQSYVNGVDVKLKVWAFVVKPL
jgi:hypothetical protein